MEIIKFPSPNFGIRKAGANIEFIILHYTAIGQEASLDNTEHQAGAGDPTGP